MKAELGTIGEEEHEQEENGELKMSLKYMCLCAKK